ncbi:MAG: nickel pincer cofactor biosynthesis protein LarB [Candidatus Thorarchaeota archaeon]
MKATRDILTALANGKISIEEAEKQIQILSLAEVGGIGQLDVNRQERSGVPEVILAETKDVDTLTEIVDVMIEKRDVALLTRVNTMKLKGLQEKLSGFAFEITGFDDHHTVLIHNEDWKQPPENGKIAILTAGTSDVAYAAEAEAIARIMGVQVFSFHDVGVAGMHRLIDPVRKCLEEDVSALVVFAGMEGALPTLVASLVDIPVIGVPVPTGYGHGGAGETALSAMLQSCAPGLSVVNIGNGLGAGAFAALVAKRCARTQDE